MSGPRDNGYHKNSADSHVFGALRRVRRSVRNKAYAFSNGVLGQFNGLRKGSLRVALVSSRKWKGKVYDDLLLQRALVKAGAKVEIVAFEDLSVDYAKYDRVVVRAMWGYQNDLKALSDWMERVASSGVKVYNDLDIIQGNFDKEKQFDGLKGLPVVPTDFIEIGGFGKVNTFTDLAGIVKQKKGGVTLDFPFVVKPTISASGDNTFLIKSEEEFLELLPKIIRVNAKKKMMLQPFIAEISGGEIGVVMISGEICHAVRRFPGVLSGKRYKVELLEDGVDMDLRDLCKKVAAKYSNALYLRIDVVRRGDAYLIMEVEAFEPELFFRLLKGDERKNALLSMANGILE